MRNGFIGIVFLTISTTVMADGGIFRRQQAVCHPHQQRRVVVDNVVEVQQAAYVPQAAPIIVQNNFPPVPATVSSIYGYQSHAQGLNYNPFQVDPSEILREAARLTDRSQNLTSESLRVYQQLGTDALGQAGLVAQLQARTALIEASRPVVVESQSVSVQTQSHTAPQALVGSSQVICLVPNGDGTYRIQVGEGSQASLPEEGVSEGAQILMNKCVGCHSGPDAEAGFVMSDDQGLVAFNPEQRTKILTSIKLNAMPPTTNSAGEPLPELSDTEVAAIQLYLR